MQPLEWQASTITAIQTETPRAKSFKLALPRWTAHQPGQHYDVRLTAPDGYKAERSYSIASPPERVGEIELTVERIVDGEVSSYLHDVAVPGDLLEVRGPIGGYFIWNVALGGPLMLVGGGSGVVPLMAMLRHRAQQKSDVPTRLLYSSRAAEDVIYKEELDRLAESDRAPVISYTFTREAPADWKGYQRRIDAAMLAEVMSALGNPVRTYVCGPTLLVESVANMLVRVGLSPGQILTERFGPTGS